MSSELVCLVDAGDSALVASHHVSCTESSATAQEIRTTTPTSAYAALVGVIIRTLLWRPRLDLKLRGQPQCFDRSLPR